MLTFILLMGFLSVVFIPMLCMLYVEAKLKNDESKKVCFWLSFIPSICIFMLYGFLKSPHPTVIPSQACGTVQFYKTYSIKHDHFERITILFDERKYNRHLRFDENIQRKNKGDSVCFEYLDKFEYPHLSESKLLKWIEP